MFAHSIGLACSPLFDAKQFVPKTVSRKIIWNVTMIFQSYVFGTVKSVKSKKTSCLASIRRVFIPAGDVLNDSFHYLLSLCKNIFVILPKIGQLFHSLFSKKENNLYFCNLIGHQTFQEKRNLTCLTSKYDWAATVLKSSRNF